MQNRFALSIALVWLVSTSIAKANSFESPYATGNATGAPGESGTLFLLPDSIYVNPLNNDIAGHTDKYLTHSTRIGWTERSDSEGFDVRAGWRFITPSYKLANHVSVRPPIGKYGDWMEVQVAYGVLLDSIGDLFYPRIQLEAGLGHLGPKAAREIQVDLHKSIKNDWEHLTWANQKRGITSDSGLEAGLASHSFSLGGARLDCYGGAGFHMNPIMLESYINFSAITAWSSSFAIAFEGKAARQYSSLLFERMRTLRTELTTGFLLTRWYKPTLTYVSPISKGDSERQIYFDVINVNWPL